VPQTARYHPEVDTFIHVMMALDQATALGDDPVMRFAVLVHDLGKGLTPADQWPAHRGHEKAGVALVHAVAQRLRVPTEFAALGAAVCEHHLLAHRALELRPTTIAKLLQRLDAYRRPARVEAFLLACEADARGRLGLETRPYPQRDYLRACFEASRDVTSVKVVEPGVTGPEVGRRLHQARVRAIAAVGDSRS
jgi:tRNA nucleotidyltransferase (CCA-adding enzyme)